MAEVQYGITEATSSLPSRSLLVQYRITEATSSLPSRSLLGVPHRGKILAVGYPAFGPNNYNGNVADMKRRYSHSKELPNISFRELTTSESLSAVAYDFANLAKPTIFDSNWFQAGRIIRTKDGVAVNVANANDIAGQLKSAQKIKVGKGHIYLGTNDFGFAEYKTFERGVQNCDTFAQGGLARVLEHTPEQIAQNLRAIASPKLYKRGVNVLGFDPINELVSRVVSLGSGRYLDYDRLGADGRLSVSGSWYDLSSGYALGGLDSGEASTQKN